MQNLHFRIVLRRDQPGKNGACKLVLSVTINGARLRISTGLSVLPAEWDDVKMKMRGRVDQEHATHVNTYLLNLKRKVDEIFFNHLNTDTILTVGKFEQEFNRKAPSGDFLIFMRNEIEAARPDQAESTIKAWVSCFNHLKTCFGTIQYGEINLALVQKFEAYLRKKKFEQNYIAKNHGFFRKYILLLAKKGKKVPNPYLEFKIRVVKKDRDYLTQQEVNGLRNLYNRQELKPHLQTTLRHFLFQVGTSLRYSDLANMTRENIMGNVLVFSPVKTHKSGRLVKCALSEMAQQMLADSESRNEKLFTTYAQPVMNRWLKEIAAYAGISTKLTTHLGRHTYGYLFIAAGGQIEVLQRIMGHSDLKTTQVYTHIDNKQIRDGVERIDALLNLSLLAD